MIAVSIGNELKSKNKNMALGIVQCRVENSTFSQELWTEIETVIDQCKANYSLETIKQQTQIEATREMYLNCGKKPSRYRPAAEQLMRRVLKNVGINNVNTLVDLVNLISLKSGYSIGGFDASAIVGSVEAGIGKENEPYKGIGRGTLNIHLLPTLRDEKGAIGTPTSDEERTALSIYTTHFFMCINAYTGADSYLEDTLNYSVDLLKKYAKASDIQITILS